ncbi:hypothetical protein Tco_1394876 [Tanacetum coccineum]
MTIQSTGRQNTTPRGGRTGGRTGRGGGRIREPTSRVGGRTGDQDGQGGDQGIGAYGGVDKVLDSSMVIAQQLQDLLPTIITQVGNRASNIQGDVRSANVSNGRNGCSYKEFMIRTMVAATEPTTIQSAVLKAEMLTDEAIRNGSLRKNTKKRGNGRELRRDGNVRDGNKRSRTMRAFAMITNPVRKEYTSTTPKRSVSIRCQGYIGDFVLGCHAKDMVVLCFGKLM